MNNRKGQTLVILLAFMAIAITIMSASIIVTAVNSSASSKVDLGNTALAVATSGVENGLIRLLRDPNYSGTGYLGEEPLAVGNGTATVSVSSGVITSRGVLGNFSRTLEVVTNYNNNVLTINSWKEIF